MYVCVQLRGNRHSTTPSQPLLKSSFPLISYFIITHLHPGSKTANVRRTSRKPIREPRTSKVREECLFVKMVKIAYERSKMRSRSNGLLLLACFPDPFITLHFRSHTHTNSHLQRVMKSEEVLQYFTIFSTWAPRRWACICE